MSQPLPFQKEFHTLDYALRHARKILLFAHTKPDPDAAGSVVGLQSYIKIQYNKTSTIGCYSSFPDFLEPVLGQQIFLQPETIDFSQYDVAIGCDSVDRGFDTIVPLLNEDCVTVAIDHHHDITLETDISIIDPAYASTTEILYNFAQFSRHQLSAFTATAYLTGIVGDTGIFQHSNTSAHTLAASADLIRSGASVSQIVNATFANQKIETLNLWGRALEHAQFYEETGMIVTAVTDQDLQGRTPTSEEIKEVATILSNVPDVRISLFLFQSSPDRVKASIRAPHNAHVDVSAIAHQFGGGGHPAASGFEIPGHLVALPDGGWKVE